MDMPFQRRFESNSQRDAEPHQPQRRSDETIRLGLSHVIYRPVRHAFAEDSRSVAMNFRIPTTWSWRASFDIPSLAGARLRANSIHSLTMPAWLCRMKSASRSWSGFVASSESAKTSLVACLRWSQLSTSQPHSLRGKGPGALARRRTFDSRTPFRFGIVIRMVVVRRDEAERHLIMGRSFQLAAGKHACRIAVDQEAQQRCRMVRRRAGAAITLAHRGQIKAVDDLHHEPGKMPLWQPLVDRRGQKEACRAIGWAEIGQEGSVRRWARIDIPILSRNQPSRQASSPTDGMDGPDGISVPQYGS